MSKKTKQPGFFDVSDRLAKLAGKSERLLRLKALVDWEAFRVDLRRVHEKERKSNAGAKPFDEVLMFKILVLQQLHNLSDTRQMFHIALKPLARIHHSSGIGRRSAYNTLFLITQ